jgi:23S rRNA pseudouridine1911/1915/1917 synthase
MSIVEIKLKTGRYHQIRAQFASRGLPIVGDLKYGATKVLAPGEISLHAHSLEFCHPVRNSTITAVSTGEALWDQYIRIQNHKEQS